MSNLEVMFERDISIISETWVPKLNPMIMKTLLASKEGVAYRYPNDVKNSFGMVGGRLVMKRIYPPRNTEICYSVYYENHSGARTFGQPLGEHLPVDKAIENFLHVLKSR